MQSNYSHKNIGFKRHSSIARVGDDLKLFGQQRPEHWSFKQENVIHKARNPKRQSQSLSVDELMAQLRERGLLIDQ